MAELSDKLKEIQREVAELRKNVEELRRLKVVCEEAKKMRKRIVDTRCD